MLLPTDGRGRCNVHVCVCVVELGVSALNWFVVVGRRSSAKLGDLSYSGRVQWF